MARRSAPPGSGPAYMTPTFGAGAGAPPHARGRVTDAKQQQEKEDGSAFSRFFREEIVAPQYIAGNINILTSIAIFAAGVFAILRELTIDLFIPQEPGPATMPRLLSNSRRCIQSSPGMLHGRCASGSSPFLVRSLVVNSCQLTQTILPT
ncbi:hypothetical protein ACEPAF_3022 [Sanghuangporus sanghuang]